jgi:hypothetical protein
MAHYEVIVGNIGTVHRGSSKAEALKQYKANVRNSEAGTGRSAHEAVTLMHDGEPMKEHNAPDIWEVRSLDVWGNAKDGYEINQIFHTSRTVGISDYSKAGIVKALRAAGEITKKLDLKHLEIETHESDIYISYRGKPQLNLYKEYQG